MAKLFLMVGNIGTGKTNTAGNLMVDAAHLENRDIVLVSIDDLALMLFNGHYGPDIWTNRHKHLYKMLKQHMVREAFNHGFDVIVDGTHMGKASRKVYIDIAKEFDADVVVYFHTYADGLNRRISNPKPGHTSPEVWTKVYNDFANAYEEPTFDEDIDEIIEIKGTNFNEQRKIPSSTS